MNHQHKLSINSGGIPVSIGDNVHIGSNTTIDRATFGYTKIGSGSRLDNLIQIAHNVSIGKNAVIAGQVGIAGSTKIGSLNTGRVNVAQDVIKNEEDKWDIWEDIRPGGLRAKNGIIGEHLFLGKIDDEIQGITRYPKSKMNGSALGS